MIGNRWRVADSASDCHRCVTLNAVISASNGSQQGEDFDQDKRGRVLPSRVLTRRRWHCHTLVTANVTQARASRPNTTCNMPTRLVGLRGMPA